MTLGADQNIFLHTFFGASYPQIQEYLKASSPEEYPKQAYSRELMRSICQIQDILTFVRRIICDATPDGLMTTRCSNYADRVWKTAFKSSKGKDNIRIHVMSFDRPGLTIENKATQYALRYKDIDVPQSVTEQLGTGRLFSDNFVLPSDTKSLFKHIGVRIELLNYLVDYLLGHLSDYVRVGHVVILDGIPWTRQILAEKLKLPVAKMTDDDLAKLSERPIMVFNGSESLEISLMDHDQFVCHTGEADCRVVFWAQKMLDLYPDNPPVVDGVDGDLFFTIMLAMLAGRLQGSTVWFRKTLPWCYTKEKNPYHVPGKLTKSGSKVPEFRKVSSEIAVYHDIRELLQGISSGDWYLEEGETPQAVTRPGAGSTFRYTDPIMPGDPKLSVADRTKTITTTIEPSLVLLFLLMPGNDFITGFYQCGFKKLYECFKSGVVLYRTMVFREKITLVPQNVTLNACCDPDTAPGIQRYSVYRYGVSFEVFKRFVFALLHSPSKRDELDYSDEDLESLLAQTQLKNEQVMQKRKNSAKNKRQSLGIDAGGDDEESSRKSLYTHYSMGGLRAAAARLAHTLAYFDRGSFGNSQNLVPNPMAVDYRGRSLYGWEYSEADQGVPVSGVLRRHVEFSTGNMIETGVYWSDYIRDKNGE